MGFETWTCNNPPLCYVFYMVHYLKYYNAFTNFAHGSSVYFPQNHMFCVTICSVLACKWCRWKHKLSMHIFHIYAQLKHPDIRTPAYPCLSQWQHWRQARDWDISGCGGSGRLIREMKLDCEEGWEERTRKDKTEWGFERRGEKKSKKKESDKPWS